MVWLIITPPMLLYLAQLTPSYLKKAHTARLMKMLIMVNKKMNMIMLIIIMIIDIILIVLKST